MGREGGPQEEIGVKPEEAEIVEESEQLRRFEERCLTYIDKLLEQGARKVVVVKGLAGLDSDRAWKMRDAIMAQDKSNSDIVAGSMAGSSFTFVWRLRSTKKAGS